LIGMFNLTNQRFNESAKTIKEVKKA